MTSSSQSLENDILFELDKLGIGTVKRRLTNELVEFTKQGAYINVEYVKERPNTISTRNTINEIDNIDNIDNSRNSYVIITIMLNGDNTLYQLNITKEYPFHAPSIVRINYKDYRFNYLKINSEKTLKELKEFIKFDCLCCSSILCPENWSPAIRLVKIIDEIKQIRYCRMIIIHRLLAKKIIDRYLIHDINLYQWLF